MNQAVTVTVPATTANLGAGFDCLGAALTLDNTFRFTPLGSAAIEPVQIRVTGTEAARVSCNESNLAYQSFVKLFQHLGQAPPPVEIAIDLAVPLARGLGSSATAIVGGLVGANVLAGEPLSQRAVMEMAIALEGHPDNVVPALLGGCQLAATDSNGTWEVCDLPWHETVVPILGIPNFELSTHEARQALPLHYNRADAIFNTAHLGMLVRGLQTGNTNWLSAALQDRIHQPYRKHLIQGYDAVQAAALDSGAFGLVISGAGPALLALAHPAQVEAVAGAIATTWSSLGVLVEVRSLQINTQGTSTKIEPSA